MENETKIEVLWEERTDMKQAIGDLTKEVQELKLLLAGFGGGAKAASAIGNILWTVVGGSFTLFATWVFNHIK